MTPGDQVGPLAPVPPPEFSSQCPPRAVPNDAGLDASPVAAKSRIAKICLADPDRFFGGASSPARCDCYGAGVAKTLSKEELSYVVTYNEIPSLSSKEYDKVKDRCLSGGATADEKPAAKKKSAKEKS